MLKTLHISNYALIETVDIDFVQGLNIITGETGAGKSIMLGALSLILGARADLKSIRDPKQKTIVEAEFDITDRDEINALLIEEDIDSMGDFCILRREITSKGGSRTFVNDTPVNLTFLRQLAVRLIDIHSQHQNLLLADPTYQLSIIDTLGSNETLLKKYNESYRNYRQALKAYTTTRDILTRSRDEEEYMVYQLEQIDELNLKQGEQEKLEHNRELLSNLTDIKQHIRSAIDAICGNNNVISNIRHSSVEISHLYETYDDASALSARLNSAAIEIEDIIDSLINFDSTLAANPDELIAIEDRLSAIYSLETRHHLENSDELITLANKLRSQIATISNGDEHLAELELVAKKAKREAVILAREISQKRKKAAKEFIDELKTRAIPLGLDNMRFEIAFNNTKLSPTGIDDLEFLFAFNKNQELMSVGRTASGGEISRVILAIKSVISAKMSLPTIIFDEVDTGISGDIANRMGREMASISTHTQVITITHLAQVASRGQRHFKVFKRDDDTSTKTHIVCLTPEERISELAMMISGDASNHGARKTAEDLISRSSI